VDESAPGSANFWSGFSSGRLEIVALEAMPEGVQHHSFHDSGELLVYYEPSAELHVSLLMDRDYSGERGANEGMEVAGKLVSQLGFLDQRIYDRS
jgi:hypothetical protein